MARSRAKTSRHPSCVTTWQNVQMKNQKKWRVNFGWISRWISNEFWDEVWVNFLPRRFNESFGSSFSWIFQFGGFVAFCSTKWACFMDGFGGFAKPRKSGRNWRSEKFTQNSFKLHIEIHSEIHPKFTPEFTGKFSMTILKFIWNSLRRYLGAKIHVQTAGSHMLSAPY